MSLFHVISADEAGLWAVGFIISDFCAIVKSVVNEAIPVTGLVALVKNSETIVTPGAITDPISVMTSHNQ
jgi:hypothetical protein